MKHYVREIDVHFLYDLNVILFRIHIKNEEEYTDFSLFPSSLVILALFFFFLFRSKEGKKQNLQLMGHYNIQFVSTRFECTM